MLSIYLCQNGGVAGKSAGSCASDAAKESSDMKVSVFMLTAQLSCEAAVAAVATFTQGPLPTGSVQVGPEDPYRLREEVIAALAEKP